MTNFDGVVIGAGHNGLTLAAYLARAGMKIAVLERNGRIGGGCEHRRAHPSRLQAQPARQFLHGAGAQPAARRPRTVSLRLFLHRAAGAAGGRVSRRHRHRHLQGPRQDLRLAGALLQAGRRDFPRALAHLLRGDAAALGLAALQRAAAARATRRPAERADRRRSCCRTRSTICSAWCASISSTSASALCSPLICT